MQNDTRTEYDSLGAVTLPAQALYGAQTQRACNNFPVSGQPMPAEFLAQLCGVKAACAYANIKVGALAADIGHAIADSATELAKQLAQGEQQSAFPVDVYQTGSGTSSNMNANEVIATLASRRLGRQVHPNDHVNMSQSSNDVIPTAMRINAVVLADTQLRPALFHLIEQLEARRNDIGDIVKTGRTHLMDATPIRFSQVIDGWVAQLSLALADIERGVERMRALPIGGTAVGTGLNAPDGFRAAVVAQLNTELAPSLQSPFVLMPQPVAGMSAQDDAGALSASLRGLAGVLIKISNDLRWMNSGPQAGLGEITLPALQPGSSIMPGKVNPVIPESVAMVAIDVQGRDAAINMAVQSGNFELNVMLPLIARNLDEMLKLSANASRLLADKAIAGFVVNRARLERDLAANPILVTALNRVIGYEKGAEIAKQAYQQQRPVIDVALELTDLSRETLQALLDPAGLT